MKFKMSKFSIGMAKPSQKDIEAAEALCQALNAIDERNRWGTDTISNCPSFDQLIEDDEFNPDDQEHLGALYNKLMTLMGENPSFHNRVISGMCHVIMYEKNQFIDPDADTLQFHPRFGEMAEALERETAAARYWNKRYHEVVAERDDILKGCNI